MFLEIKKLAKMNLICYENRSKEKDKIYLEILKYETNYRDILMLVTTLAILFFTLYQKYQYRYEKLLTEYKYLVKNSINRKKEIQNLKKSLKIKESDLTLYDKENDEMNTQIHILKIQLETLQNELNQKSIESNIIN